MSIHTYREYLKGIPGAQDLIMSYDQGGKIEVWSIGDKSVGILAPATPADVRAAFENPA